MLRQVREDVEKHYYDPAFHGIDLKAAFAAAEQSLKTAPTLTDAFATLSDVLFQLDDSHTVFIPPNRRTRIDYGWQMAMVGDVPLVTSVDPRSDAAAQRARRRRPRAAAEHASRRGASTSRASRTSIATSGRRRSSASR